MVSNLALFRLATFQKIGQFFPNHLVSLHPAHLPWGPALFVPSPIALIL
jgi:hypothetical protein